MSRPPRALCVRRGGFGDTLLMTPVLRALRRAHPGCTLEFAGVHEFAAVLAGYGVVDAARSSEDLRSWELATRPAARARLSAWTHVVADDPAFAAAAAPGTMVQCFEPRPQRFDRPLAQQIAAQLGLTLGAAAEAWLAPRAVAGEVVWLAPGSGAVAKCWPRAHWLALAALFAAGGLTLAVVVGPVETERDDPRTWPWPAPVAFVVEPTPLGLARRMAAARAFVGNDSGPTHLAAMLGVPTLALFGGGWPAVFAPQGPCVEVLQAAMGDLARLTPDAVAARLAGLGH